MIVRNKGFSFKYIGRVLFLLNAGIWSSIFSYTEKKKLGKQIKQANTPDNPLIIVGNWRTGTTFLHQLIARDPQFTTPTVFQVSHPNHFLVSKKYYKQIMTKALGNKRPMDNVKLGIDEPQEDEYALLKTVTHTPLEKLLFSKNEEFYNVESKSFNPINEQKFISQLKLFCTKLTLHKKTRVLLKNPFHSLRIKLLKKHFPQAQFIHLIRNPENVIPSTINMWNIVGKQNKIKGKHVSPTIQQIASTYALIINEVRKSFRTLENNQHVEIRFENLEKKPIETIKNIYNQLQIKFTPQYEQTLTKHLQQLKGYKKNNYELSPENREKIKDMMTDTLPEYYS